MEGEEVDREVSPPILKREREEEPPDSLLWVSGELGSPTFKPPSDTRSPEGGGEEMDIVGGQFHNGKVSGHILQATAQGTPGGGLGLVVGGCGVKYGKEGGRGS